MADTQADFDVTVIGSGPGGYVAAIRAAQLGLKTALVEKWPALGGTCLHVGCIPTKSLLYSAEVLELARDGARFGVKTGDVKLDLQAAHKHKSDVIRRQARGLEYLMKKNGITVLPGHGRLKGPGKVEVTAKEGAKQVVGTKNLILATGSVPKMLPGLKVDGTRVITSNEALAPDDSQITGPLTVRLRAERLGEGTGRVYTIVIKCTDRAGNSAFKTVTVTVPHDM